ncbi:phage head-tail connector protein [Enterococcus avium]|uniref:phage head-tail connector protein n=1 Tax=Enterococcus avium TaxID=33945 RepID=UPI0032E4829D
MDENKVLTEVKTLIGVTDQDDTLKSIISIIQRRLKTRLDQETIPEELGYIVIEASISRFNRISDEGKKISAENEVSATWLTDDLAIFENDIKGWIAKNSETTAKVVRFL